MIALNPILLVYLAVFVAGVGLDLWLVRLNVRHLAAHGREVPEPLVGHIDDQRLATISAYTVAQERFEALSSCIASALFLFVILWGMIPAVAALIQGLGMGPVPSGLCFFGVVALAQTVFSLPFSYYRTFVIETRYGFNTSTLRMWVVDMVKGMVVGSVIGGILLAAVLVLIEWVAAPWWFWAWCVFFFFQLLLLVIYPTMIAPWFNRFDPLDDKGLEEKIREVMARGGLAVEGVFKMDAGKRSRHTNAYFTGLGRTKRIVLFDTLLAAHSQEEILAVLAHEIGHWKKRHVLKRIVLVGGVALLVFFAASLCLRWHRLYEAFGFEGQAPYVGLFLFVLLWEAMGRFLTPLGNALSRRHEREADAFAAQLLGSTKALADALKRLARDNLSNLYPHPAYAWFHYSHPPILERVQSLEKGLGKGQAGPSAGGRLAAEKAVSAWVPSRGISGVVRTAGARLTTRKEEQT